MAILVIDTSSSRAALATIDERRTETFMPARSPELIPQLRRMAAAHRIDKVAVAIGPGSFTGLRKGVSFGVGLAMGLRVPIIPLRTLELQAARSHQPATAVVEAGRGRFYFRTPDGEQALGAPADIPTTHPLVGMLSDSAQQLLVAAGHVLAPERELTAFSEAAEHLLKTARELPYESVKLEYMQTFEARL
jgi:tRNA threonylcarbamoyl adenosine modification protein YeaZ